MARFMAIKSVNRKLKQDQIAKYLGCSTSTLKRYRKDINMLSLYRISPITHKNVKRFQLQTLMIANREHNLKRHQMTPKDLKMTSNDSITNKRSESKAGDLSIGSILNEQSFCPPINA